MIVSNPIFTQSSTDNFMVLVIRYTLIHYSEKFRNNFLRNKWLLIVDDDNTMQFIHPTNISNIYLSVFVIDKSHNNRKRNKNSKLYQLQNTELCGEIPDSLNEEYYTVPMGVVSKFNEILNDRDAKNNQDFLEIIGNRIAGLPRKTSEILEN